MTSNTPLKNLGGRASRPQEDKCMCDTISSKLFRNIGVNSLNNVGEVSGEVIHEVGYRGFDTLNLLNKTS